MGFADQWLAYSKTLTHVRDDLVAQRDDRSSAEKATPLDQKTLHAVPAVGVPPRIGDGKAVVPTLYMVDPDGTVWAEEYPGAPRDFNEVILSSEVSVEVDDESTLRKGDDEADTITLLEGGAPKKEKLTLQALKKWTEQVWARDLSKRGASALLASRVLEVPVFEEVTMDSLSLAFDTSWPQITRCNGITGKQILTDSLLVPLSASTYGIPLLADSRQTDRIALQQDEKTLEEQRLCRFMRESGCTDAMAAHFYLAEASSFEEAVALFKEDKDWGERHAHDGRETQDWEGGEDRKCHCVLS